MMSFYEQWAVAIATFRCILIMIGDCSSCSANTVLYEDFCNKNNIPLSLKKGSTAVPESIGEYSFGFIVSPRVPGMFSPVEEPSMSDSSLGYTLNASAGSVESYNSVVTCNYSSDFAKAVQDFDLSFFDLVAEIPSVDAVDSGASVSTGCRDSFKPRVSDIEDHLGLFYMVLWRVSPRRAVRKVTLLCQELFIH